MNAIADLKADFDEQGFAVARGLFSQQECARYIEHYMTLRESGTYPGDYGGEHLTATDPLKKYPRMIQMHEWDALTMEWFFDSRLTERLTVLMGREPYALQTMLYFKPAGARGQALHQDQWYLRVHPGTCIAAWLSLDDTDEENGCMQVVPGTAHLPLLCAERADTKVSFTDITVPLAEGMTTEPVRMKAGDVLFFGGSLIHGSYPNTSRDRFRRSLIGHYISGEAEEVGSGKVLRLSNGETVKLRPSPKGTLCGVWRGGEVEVIEQDAIEAKVKE